MLPLRLNLILCPGGLDRDLCRACVQERVSLFVFGQMLIFTGNEPLDVREIECNLPSVAHCSGGAMGHHVLC